MTYIPGTSKPESVKTDFEKQGSPQTLNSVNVEEIAKAKTVSTDEAGVLWYHTLKAWLLAGFLLGVILTLVFYTDWKTLFFIPLLLYVSYLAWHTRKWFKKVSKMDPLN